MEVVYTQCCGLDVHKHLVVACLLTAERNEPRHQEIRTFSTLTAARLALGDGGKGAGCTGVAMEATGVFWNPSSHLLAGQFALLVVKAQHSKAVPGRKTAGREAEWIADLLHHGVLTGSVIPSPEQRAWRELPRLRTRLVEERARLVKRLQQVVEDPNLKLAAVATDLRGKSARALLEALLTGETDSQQSWRRWPGGVCAKNARAGSRRWSGGSGPSTAS